MKFTKGHWALALFTIGYLVFAAVRFGSVANYEFLIYSGIVAFIGAIVWFTLPRTQLDLVALWGLSLWGFVHMLGGAIMVGDGVLYGIHVIDIFDRGGQLYILKMDQIIHFYGFGVSAMVIYQLLLRGMSVRKNPFIIPFVAILGAMGLGALNEVLEFLILITVERNGVGDLYNMGLDLVFNTLGAIVGTVIQHRRAITKS